MKKPFAWLLSALFALTLPTACQDSPDGEADEELVVEGWIADGDFPVVLVSTTVVVTEESQTLSSLSDHVQHWARVTVSDGNRKVTLMGSYDKRYFPPYKYSTTELRGEAGKTYRISVDAGGRHAEAVTTIPAPVTLDSITAEDAPELPLGHQFYAVFRNTDDITRYYTLFYLVGRTTQQFVLSTMGVFDQSMIGQGTIRYPLNINDNILEQQEDTVRPQYLCVRLATVDSISYTFWRDYQDTYTMSGNFLMPHTNRIRGNVEGALGYWCGMGASDRWMVVTE